MAKKRLVAKAPNPLASAIERTSHILSTTADHAARRIYLFGEIDEGAAYRFMVALQVMDSTPGEIVVFMNTPGGSIENGYAIFDAIRFTQNPVTVVGFGGVMSMGAIIMQAADLRLMAPKARFMVHTGNAGFDGEVDSDKLISIGEEMAGIRDRFIEILAERSGQAVKKVREWVLKETYLSAEEAFAHGFVDGIVVMPEKTPMKTIKVKRGRR